MKDTILVLRLREIVVDLEQRQLLISRWLVHEDPELVAHGQAQRALVDRYHGMLRDLMVDLQTESSDSG